MENVTFDLDSSLDFLNSFGNNSQFNDTGFSEVDEYEAQDVPLLEQVIWAIFAAIVIVVGTGGNVIVIYIVLADRRMRTVTNYLLVNLSIADCLVSLLNVGFNSNYLIYQDWIFGDHYCKFCQCLVVLAMVGSIFTLMAISIERYIAIVHPLRPRMSEQTTVCVAIAIWLVSTVLSLPHLLFNYTEVITSSDGEYVRTICYMEWPDSPSNVTNGEDERSVSEQLYNVTFTCITYIIPLITIGYAYSRVAIELWGSQVVGEATPHQLENIQAKRKVVKMMLVVVFIFTICWLPYNLYFIIVDQHSEVTHEKFTQTLYIGIWFLAMSNSMYNPFIYCWMNARFRKGFKRVFRRCVPSCWKKRDSLQIYRYSCSSPDTRVFRNGSTRLPMNHLAVGQWSRTNSSRRTLSTLVPESRHTSPMSLRNWRCRNDQNENQPDETIEIPLTELETRKSLIQTTKITT